MVGRFPEPAASENRLRGGEDRKPMGEEIPKVPLLGTKRWTGEYTVWHEPPAVRAAGRLTEGRRVLISYYHTAVIHHGQVTCCMSAPKLYEILDWQIAQVKTHHPLAEMHVRPSELSKDRLARLRRADAIVRRFTRASGFDRKVWQFPVVLLPVGTEDRPDSIVLRPVHSVDGMTAQSVLMDRGQLESLAVELLGVEGVCGIFYDLTHKPPATIEWE